MDYPETFRIHQFGCIAAARSADEATSRALAVADGIAGCSGPEKGEKTTAVTLQLQGDSRRLFTLFRAAAARYPVGHRQGAAGRLVGAARCGDTAELMDSEGLGVIQGEKIRLATDRIIRIFECSEFGQIPIKFYAHLLEFIRNLEI